MILTLINFVFSLVGAFYVGTRLGDLIGKFWFRRRILAKAKNLDNVPNSCAMHAVKTICTEIPSEKIVRGFLAAKGYDKHGSIISNLDEIFDELSIKITKYQHYPLEQWVAARAQENDLGPYFCVVWVKGSPTMHATTYKDGKIIDSSYSQQRIANSHFVAAYQMEV